MALWKKYLQPSTVEDALVALGVEPDRSAVVAGGTDLLLDLQQGRYSAVNTLVDVTQIPEMTAIQKQDDFLHFGAAVSLYVIVQAPEIIPIVVEHPTSEGPYGAKGVGEVSSIPTTPVITNAINNACGIRVRTLPVDQDWLALELAKVGGANRE